MLSAKRMKHFNIFLVPLRCLSFAYASRRGHYYCAMLSEYFYTILKKIIFGDYSSYCPRLFIKNPSKIPQKCPRPAPAAAVQQQHELFYFNSSPLIVLGARVFISDDESLGGSMA